MNKKERVIRVLVSSAIVLAGLFLLNHAVFSFWVSSGPPNEYPDYWYQQGIIWWWRATALLMCGILCQFRFATLKASKVVKAVIVISVMGLLYPYIREFILVDICLDNGGSWSKEHFRCTNA
ncbi:hypothetical protein [Teredinibacter turnerae]|uniref:hypothetical protein n=1 Tax=Teredinibacter turnerae TaxID=2426 RepID=UPI0012BB9AFA|nr:hypothetical protein [Teredinibacter turnerae]